MTAPYAVPLTRIPVTPATNQTFTVNLNGTDYRMRLMFDDVIGWVLDIGDAAGVPIVAGIPIFTGSNLLGQYDHLKIGGGGGLFCSGPILNPDPPTFEGLGADWQLYFSPPTNSSTGMGLSYVPDALAGKRLD